MNNQRWTNEEIVFLKRNINLMSRKELAIELDRSINSIKSRLGILGLLGEKGGFKKGHKIGLGMKHSEKTKEKISKGNSGKIVSKKTKKRQSETRKRLYAEGKLKKFFGEDNVSSRQEVRDKISKSLHGRSYEDLLGVEKAKERKEAISRIHTGKILSKETKMKMAISKLGEKNPSKRPEVIEKIKNSLKKLWENPETAKELSRKIISGHKERPTSYEKKISELCIEYNLPFIYTGDGTFIIGRKNPDFKHRSLPIVIEVFSNYYKKKNYGSVENYMDKRSEYFSKYGYKTIFIGEKQILGDGWKNKCIIKIIEGMENG